MARVRTGAVGRAATRSNAGTSSCRPAISALVAAIRQETRPTFRRTPIATASRCRARRTRKCGGSLAPRRTWSAAPTRASGPAPSAAKTRASTHRPVARSPSRDPTRLPAPLDTEHRLGAQVRGPGIRRRHVERFELGRKLEARRDAVRRFEHEPYFLELAHAAGLDVEREGVRIVVAARDGRERDVEARHRPESEPHAQ